jgi:hypothetical protein
LQAENGAEALRIKAFLAIETFQVQNRASKTADGSNCRLRYMLNAGNHYLCGNLKTSKISHMNKKNVRRAVHG